MLQFAQNQKKNNSTNWSSACRNENWTYWHNLIEFITSTIPQINRDFDWLCCCCCLCCILFNLLLVLCRKVAVRPSQGKNVNFFIQHWRRSHYLMHYLALSLHVWCESLSLTILIAFKIRFLHAMSSIMIYHRCISVRCDYGNLLINDFLAQSIENEREREKKVQIRRVYTVQTHIRATYLLQYNRFGILFLFW